MRWNIIVGLKWWQLTTLLFCCSFLSTFDYFKKLIYFEQRDPTAHFYTSLTTLFNVIDINNYLSPESAARPRKPSAIPKNHLEGTGSFSPGACSLVQLRSPVWCVSGSVCLCRAPSVTVSPLHTLASLAPHSLSRDTHLPTLRLSTRSGLSPLALLSPLQEKLSQNYSSTRPKLMLSPKPKQKFQYSI